MHALIFIFSSLKCAVAFARGEEFVRKFTVGEHMRNSINTIVIAVTLVISSIHVCMAVSVNAGRIAQLNDNQIRQRTIMDVLAHEQKNVEDIRLLKEKREYLIGQIESLRGQINYGRYEDQIV